MQNGSCEPGKFALLRDKKTYESVHRGRRFTRFSKGTACCVGLSFLDKKILRAVPVVALAGVDVYCERPSSLQVVVDVVMDRKLDDCSREGGGQHTSNL